MTITQKYINNLWKKCLSHFKNEPIDDIALDYAYQEFAKELRKLKLEQHGFACDELTLQLITILAKQLNKHGEYVFEDPTEDEDVTYVGVIIPREWRLK